MSVQSIDIPIIGDSNKVPQDDPSFTLNLYAEQVAKDVYTLKPTPGTELEGQLSVNGGGRGQIVVAGRLFGVRGGFFQEFIDGVGVVLGNLASNSGPVALISNVKPDNAHAQILIVDVANGYVFDLAAETFTVLTEADNGFVGGGSQAAYCAGKAYVFKPGTTFFQSSDAYDFATWNTSANSAMQSLSTPITSIVGNGDLVYGFSDRGFEVWQEQGLPVFSVRQILSGDNIGILAIQSAQVIERYVYWIGKTSTGEGVVYRHTGGGQPERVSTHPIERQIASLDTPSDCIGDTYNSLGHTFYLLTFTAGNKTLCLDKTTGLWHDRAQRDPISGAVRALPYFSLVILDGEVLGLDSRNGKVWRLDDEIYTDDGNPIVRERILSVVPKEADYLTFYQSAELFGTIGNTPVTEDPPNIMMKYSTDRGMTWSLEQWEQAGGNSTYGARTRWVGLGAAYGLALWFRIVCNQFISWRMVRIRAE